MQGNYSNVDTTVYMKNHKTGLLGRIFKNKKETVLIAIISKKDGYFQCCSLDATNFFSTFNMEDEKGVINPHGGVYMALLTEFYAISASKAKEIVTQRIAKEQNPERLTFLQNFKRHCED